MRITTIALFLLLLSSAIKLQGQVEKYNLLIGTYTAGNNGIHVYSFDAETGAAKSRSKTTGITNPSFLAISNNKNHVYAVSEVENGSVSAYAFDAKKGTLTLLNEVTSGGAHPCYVSVDDKDELVFVGNYSTGNLSAIQINDDGSLHHDIQTIRHEGSSINKKRQKEPHVHGVVVSPENQYLYVPDLGIDKVKVYDIDHTGSKVLTARGEVAVTPGSGPRHFTFHPNGKYAYLIQELDATITAYHYKNGKLKLLESESMIPSNFTGDVGAADIHVSPDGKFLYASNRGDANELVIYAINRKGKLTFVDRQSTLGKTPRNFALDPTGKFLLVANQDSNEVVFFRRNEKTGLLTPTGKRIQVNKPVCLKFVSLE